MWNDTDAPLAVLITFRTYGSWLHGDERGSVSRHRNVYGTRYLPPEEKWVETNIHRLKSKPVTLDAKQRECVDGAIRETCQIRGWVLLAINVRTNHVHVVASIGGSKSSLVLNAFKANATRRMRETGCWDRRGSPWVDKGSARNLWNERSVEKAIDYVINGQGGDLPDFD
jgi:REP element-mobilizing transposase RayT